VHQAALADLVLVAVERERRGAAVDEVQLVLGVVEVVRPLVPGREEMPLTPKAVTPSAPRTLRKPGPSPSASKELTW